MTWMHYALAFGQLLSIGVAVVYARRCWLAENRYNAQTQQMVKECAVHPSQYEEVQ